MNREIIGSYAYLLGMVNKQIKLCLSAKYHFEEEIKLNSHLDSFHFKWYKEVIRNEKLYLKQLKEIKRFLIKEIRFEKMNENVVDKLEAKYENTKN